MSQPAAYYPREATAQESDGPGSGNILPERDKRTLSFQVVEALEVFFCEDGQKGLGELQAIRGLR